MKKYSTLTLIFCLLSTLAFAQHDHNHDHDHDHDKVIVRDTSSVFARHFQAVKDYKVDTTAVPNDSITKLITELRNLGGGFNISEVIQLKIEEDREKQGVSSPEFEKATVFFKTGAGKKWLDNAVIRIYRNHFTYDELKDLVNFYKTPAGKKMAAELPVVTLKSIRVAEVLREYFVIHHKE